MNYLLILYIPQKLNLSSFYKENLESLTGEVISSKYYLSIKLYNTFNITINGLVDAINNLIEGSHFNQHLSGLDNLSDTISTLIDNNFIYIDTVNGEKVSGNINVVTSFYLNHFYYNYIELNNGVIRFPYQVLSGNITDNYVLSFNGKTGDITGLSALWISNKTFIANNENLGKLTLNLIPATLTFVKTINGEKENVSGILSSVIFNEEVHTNINITIPISLTKYVINENNNLSSITLSSVSNHSKSAFNFSYLNNTTESIIKRIQVLLNSNEQVQLRSVEVILDKNYFPLHFYKLDGTMINLLWKCVDYNELNNKIIITYDSSQISYTKITMTAIRIY